jgi:hypothetical protein
MPLDRILLVLEQIGRLLPRQRIFKCHALQYALPHPASTGKRQKLGKPRSGKAQESIGIKAGIFPGNFLWRAVPAGINKPENRFLDRIHKICRIHGKWIYAYSKLDALMQAAGLHNPFLLIL